MQICAPGQHRQRLVSGIAAHVRPQIQRMQGLFQKMQVRAVGVVHQQQRIMPVTDLCKALHLRHAAQIVGAGDVHGGGRRRKRCQRVFQLIGRNAAGTQGIRLLRPQPAYFQPQQRRSVNESLVDVPRRQNQRRTAGLT